MSLDKRKSTLQVPGLIMDVIPYKDVKEAVLKAKEEFKELIYNYDQRPSTMAMYENIFKEIFGDFKK